MERGKRRTDLPGPSLRLRVHTSPLRGHPGYRIGAPRCQRSNVIGSVKSLSAHKVSF